MCPQGNPTSTSYFSFYLWDHGVSYFLSYWVAALFFPFFSFYIIFPTETGAKNKRPQARPRAKESVMIPTLLMNIPTSPKQPNNTILVCKRLWFFFCEFFFFCFLFFYCGMEWQGGIHRDRREEERKCLGSGNWPNRRGKKSGSHTLSFSRLVKSSPSFLLEVTPECN
jgi:hypothetical protein